jgi:phage N-6-adenine-methyltransferase
MATFENKFHSERQDWETPDDLFKLYDDEFHFTLDAAASETNKRCSKFFSKENSAMDNIWGAEVVWLNPPYGGTKSNSLQAWIKKSLEQSLLGSTVVMLIPARTNTNWFHDVCLKYGEVRFIKGRPKFKGCIHGLPQPLCVVIFRPSK